MIRRKLAVELFRQHSIYERLDLFVYKEIIYYNSHFSVIMEGAFKFSIGRDARRIREPALVNEVIGMRIGLKIKVARNYKRKIAKSLSQFRKASAFLMSYGISAVVKMRVCVYKLLAALLAFTPCAGGSPS